MQCELKRFLEYVPLNEWTYDFQRTVGTYLCPKKRLFEKKISHKVTNVLSSMFAFPKDLLTVNLKIGN